MFPSLFRVFGACLRPCFGFVPILAALLFLGALFWAKQQDPFSRRWFNVPVAGHSLNCVAVLPKPVRPCPVIIYAHGAGGTLMNDGRNLRQMAELGLAAVSFEYDQTNPAYFAGEFAALGQYVVRQPWAMTNAMGWVGFSLGANEMLDYAVRHPDAQPRLLVQLSGAEVLPAGTAGRPFRRLHCAVLLLHSDQDGVFPVSDARQCAAFLQSNGVPVALKIVPGVPHDFEPEQALMFRCLGEYCLAHLTSADPWRTYRSIARWQAESPALLWFWLPAAVWIVGSYLWKHRARPRLIKRPNRPWPEITLRWLATILAIWALTETGLHLVPPHLAVNDRTIRLARRYCVPPKARGDFEYLAAQPIWHGEKVRGLLDHVELAGYNRELINWTLEDKIYQTYVLSPVIAGAEGERLNWRRPLWEEFYPRIRHENSPAEAARIVVRHLRERITVANLSDLSPAIPDIWLRQLTDRSGFEIIYVAALRSVGVPARLDAAGQAEIYAEDKWQPAPRPLIYNAF